MLNKNRIFAAFPAALALGVLFAWSPIASAGICKYIDGDGNITYSNLPVKDARRVTCLDADEPARKGADSPAANRSRAAQTPTPASFPRVDASTQRSRDDMRRKVLGDELASEEKLLAEARIQYNNGAPAPMPGEQADAQKYAERIARLRQNVALHERNIEALRRELAATR